MAALPVQSALTMLRQALPALEVLAAAETLRTEQEAAVTKLAADLVALETRRTRVSGQLEEDLKAGEVARQRMTQDHQATLGLFESRIEDFQRRQQAAEAQLAATTAVVDQQLRDLRLAQQAAEEQRTALRAESTRITAQRATDLAKALTAHEDKIADLVKQEQAAAGRLVSIQDKIKALHGDLAGMATA